jgi:opacity protein-like surface antigen
MRSPVKYFIIGSFLFLAARQKAAAQSALEMQVGYEVNLPSGSFRNYITNPAFKGFTAGLAYPINDQLSVGIDVGFNDYYQKYPRQVYEEGKGSAISAVVSNSIQQIPLMINASYTLLRNGMIRPYVGAGAGVNLISFDQYLGEFDNPQSKAKLTFRGDAGFLIPLSRYSTTAIKIGAGYQYAPYDKEINLNSWGVHAGIRFALR